MKKVLFVFLILGACKNSAPDADKIANYYNPEKWQWRSEVMGNHLYEHVVGNPVEVKETFLTEYEPGSEPGALEIPVSQHMKFDKDGNVVYSYILFRDSSKVFEWFDYNENGKQSWSCSSLEPDPLTGTIDTMKTTSIRMNDGRYKRVGLEAGSYVEGAYVIQSYFDEGFTLKEEQFLPVFFANNSAGIVDSVDATGKVKPGAVLTSIFNKQHRILRSDQKNGDYVVTAYDYVYDNKGFVESIAYYEGEKKKRVVYFSNDANGNPVKSDQFSFSYVYDAKGNWTKRTGWGGDRAICTVREITYK